MMKFACFEKTVVALYDYVVPKPRAECSKAEQLVVTFAAGYIAGVFCAIVSHPADTLVSYLNKAPGAGIGAAVKTLGFGGLWQGLGPRIIMIGTLTALQWFIYDGVKVSLGFSFFFLNVKLMLPIFVSGPAASSPSTSPGDARLPQGQDGCGSVLDLAI